ncbi:TetR/AcrR family transcriptional regulator [Actinomadura viridis]|uniref:TetR/AcrR family transcriptional regulator n=1 Tax=Actinomadura viridis TaxID=58110 RepID=UPI0036866BEA
MSPPRRQARPGRAGPRHEEAILRATYDLVLDVGLQATTMDAIAERAGVSKVTLYKWWPNRAAIVMAAFLEHGRTALPYPDPVSPEQLRRQLRRMAREFQGPTGRVIAELMAEGQYHPDIKAAFRDGYIGPRREEGVRIIRSAVDSGIIRDVEPHVALDLIYAPLYYRLLVGHGPLNGGFVDAHVDAVWRALAAE